jgi:triosephosphate isomerase
LKGRKADEFATLVIAYEPIWAIGTGLTATAQDAQDVCHHIRAVVRTEWGSEAADKVRIQYGGSVKAGNVSELMAQPDIDGALVGGASIDPDEFARIVQFKSS